LNEISAHGGVFSAAAPETKYQPTAVDSARQRTAVCLARQRTNRETKREHSVRLYKDRMLFFDFSRPAVRSNTAA
jgi:hypothetical protein